MRAIRVHEHGGPEALRLDEVPEPEPGPGQARVRLEAAGVNFIDTYFRSGLYPAELPLTLGQEGAGTVDAVGEGVDGVRQGERVAFMSGTVTGAYADCALVDAAQLVAVPDGVEARTACAVLLQGITAHYLSTSTFPLREGHRALVHAAAGGVGLLLTQMAKMRGATVYGTVSSEEKAALAREAGADEVIRYDQMDFAEEVHRLAGEPGLDVVYESVGKDTFDRSLGCLRPRGYLVLFGQSSGPVPPFDPQVLARGGSLFLTRPIAAHYTLTRDELGERAGDVLGWVRDGSLQVRIGEEHPLEDAALAHERLQGRLTTGKVLLRP